MVVLLRTYKLHMRSLKVILLLCCLTQLGTIAGGQNNFMDRNSLHNFIGGGYGNTVSNSYGYSVIGGGSGNTVSANCAAILGGFGNTVSGAYSAILGGANNTDSGYPNIGMYGNGLAVSLPVPGVPSSFWVDSLVSPSIPVITSFAGWGALPIGTLYTTVALNTGCAASPVYVK